MIEWIHATTARPEIIPGGEYLHGYPEPVGEGRPDVIGLAILQDGEGAVIEGTPDELRQFLARAAAALDAHEADRSN